MLRGRSDRTDGYLAAPVFGDNKCFLEIIGAELFCAKVEKLTLDGASPTAAIDHTTSVFKIIQAMSSRALSQVHEADGLLLFRYAHPEDVGERLPASSKTILYGHAVQVRGILYFLRDGQLLHVSSGQLLSCLGPTAGGDGLSLDLGLCEPAEGASTWFRIRPATKQRSDGEKVCCNDEVYLVSEREQRYIRVDDDEGGADTVRLHLDAQRKPRALTNARCGLPLQKRGGQRYCTAAVRFPAHLMAATS